MRRAMLLILLLALLGVSTSLGVAWFIGGVQPGWAATDDVEEERVGEWGGIRWTGHGQRIRQGYAFAREVKPPIRPASKGSVFAQPPRSEDEVVMEVDIGWPVLSWRAAWLPHPSRYGAIKGGDFHGGLFINTKSISGGLSMMEPVSRLLPLRPIWPGVVYDSALWAGFWLVITLVLLAPGRVRRRLRLRRHRCTMCGYDLRGCEAARCSECGAARGARGPVLGNRILGSLGAALLLLVIAQITVGAKVASLSHGPNRLHLAARDGDVRAIERALRNGVPVDVPVNVGHDAAGTTPLIWAIAGDQADAVRLLLDHGADAKAQNENGQPAIVFATETRNEQVFAALLAKGADPNTTSGNGQPVLYWLIAEEGGAACARHLIDAGADANAKWSPFTLLAVAAGYDDLAMARLLIDAGADVNAPVEGLPIIAAVRGGHIEMTRLLIDAGAEVGRSELELLRLAVEEGCAEVVGMLLAHDAPRPVITSGPTLLHTAVSRCDTAMVRLLAQSGFDPTIRDGPGRTAFEQAIDASLLADEYDEIVEILDAAVRAWYPGDGDDEGG